MRRWKGGSWGGEGGDAAAVEERKGGSRKNGWLGSGSCCAEGFERRALRLIRCTDERNINSAYVKKENLSFSSSSSSSSSLSPRFRIGFPLSPSSSCLNHEMRDEI